MSATYLVAGFLWFSARSYLPPLRRHGRDPRVDGIRDLRPLSAAPPWLASHYGELDPTTRSIAVIWGEIPVVHVNTFFEEGSQYANPVAAVPSLHAAYTLLITLILWRPAPHVGRLILAAYPWAMAFALVYTAGTTSSTSCSDGSTRWSRSG